MRDPALLLAWLFLALIVVGAFVTPIQPFFGWGLLIASAIGLRLMKVL